MAQRAQRSSRAPVFVAHRDVRRRALRASTLVVCRKAPAPPWQRPANSAAHAWCSATRNRPPHSNLDSRFAVRGLDRWRTPSHEQHWYGLHLGSATSASRCDCSPPPPFGVLPPAPTAAQQTGIPALLSRVGTIGVHRCKSDFGMSSLFLWSIAAGAALHLLAAAMAACRPPQPPRACGAGRSGLTGPGLARPQIGAWPQLLASS